MNTSAVAVLVAAAVVLSACSSSGGSSSSSAGAHSGGSSSGASGGLAAFTAKVDKDVAAAAQRQSFRPPASGPAATTGKTVYVIACILAAEGCARESRAAIEAGKAIGWNMKLLDTGSVPATMANDIQQAINAHADGLIVQAIDAKFIAGPLAKAKAAGMKVVCFACINQNGLVDEQIPSEKAFYDAGYTLGEEMYKQTKGHPRLIFMYDASFGVTGVRKRGTEQFFKDCQAAGGDCKIVDTENFLVTELSTRVPGLASQAVRAHTDANCIWMSYDSAQSFIAQGLRQAGLSSSKVGLYGFDGNTANIGAIRKSNFQVATMAGPFEWVGWAQVDSLNRYFAGQKPMPDVIHFKLITNANVPPTDTYSGDLPFKPGYLKVWGK